MPGDTTPWDDGEGPESFGRSGGYEWACPLCGKSTVNRLSTDDDGQAARSSLRLHIQNAVDEVHGERFAFPEGFDPDALADAVKYVDRKPQ